MKYIAFFLSFFMFSIHSMEPETEQLIGKDETSSNPSFDSDWKQVFEIATDHYANSLLSLPTKQQILLTALAELGKRGKLVKDEINPFKKKIEKKFLLTTIAEEVSLYPLHEAAQQGNIELLQMLRKHQLNFDVKNKEQKTPFIIAAQALKVFFKGKTSDTLKNRFLCMEFFAPIVIPAVYSGEWHSLFTALCSCKSDKLIRLFLKYIKESKNKDIPKIRTNSAHVLALRAISHQSPKMLQLVLDLGDSVPYGLLKKKCLNEVRNPQHFSTSTKMLNVLQEYHTKTNEQKN